MEIPAFKNITINDAIGTVLQYSFCFSITCSSNKTSVQLEEKVEKEIKTMYTFI